MFGKKKENDFMKMFREVDEDTSENNDYETNEMTIKEKVMAFIKCFPYQSPQYKIVWIIRIGCWFLVFGVAIFGTVLRIKKYFTL